MSETGDEVGVGADGEERGGSRSCKATAKDGRPCGAPPMKGESFCYMHSPATATERKEAAKRGGVTTSARRRLLLGRLTFGDLGEVREARQALAAAVIVGQVHPARAGVVASLVKDAEASFSTQELEARMTRIEASLAKLVAQRSRSAGEA